MNILLVNKFLYPRGGAAISTIDTGKLLAQKGHKVIFWGVKHPSNPFYPYSNYFVNNLDYNGDLSVKEKFLAFFNILYSFEAKGKIEKLVNIVKPDIVHLNNFAHQISPSILTVFKKYNIPIVMTMRDYKLVCPSAGMFVDDKTCEKCKHQKYYWCLLKKCKKNSYLKSFINTIESYLHHNILHLYELVDIFIAPSVFSKNKVKEMGFKGKIIYLPNFVNLDELIPKFEFKKEICYFGRLSYQKGIKTLIDAVKGLDIVLKIIGTGLLEEELRLKVKKERIENIRFVGYKTGNELMNEIKKSMAVVVPTECYEVFGRVVIEAFALGKPVIASRIGAIPEIVEEDKNGYFFKAGDVVSLRNKILKLLKNQDKIVEMGKNARKLVEERFNADRHYERLIEIYSHILEK